VSTGNSNRIYTQFELDTFALISEVSLSLSLSPIFSIIHTFPVEKSYTRPYTSKASAKTGSEAKPTDATHISIRVDTC